MYIYHAIGGGGLTIYDAASSTMFRQFQSIKMGLVKSDYSNERLNLSAL